MSVISVFSGPYCSESEVVQEVSRSLGYELIGDRELIGEAAGRFDISENKLRRAVYGKTSVFNKFTHERERSIAYLKAVMADFLKRDEFTYFGFGSLLIPESITHVLKVCIIADMKYRIQQAMELGGLSEKDAVKLIHREDESRILWTKYLFDKEPWDSSIYDIMIPMDKRSVAEAVELIKSNASRDIVQPGKASLKAVEDFALAAQVGIAIANEGHNVAVSANDGHVTLSINKNVILLSRLEDELKRIVSKVPGVKEVEAKVGPGFYQTDIYRRYDFETPSRVLLVDDEREFVQTLSERLLMRQMGSAVVYDGEQALSFVAEEEPDVMILDLRMPGIDGIEVLRRVKAEHPDIEVIILTGHGTRKDEEMCMQLGAFAYLQKPVDIDVLTNTLRKAYAKAESAKG